jgi:opacity protein-like surface antigen
MPMKIQLRTAGAVCVATAIALCILAPLSAQATDTESREPATWQFEATPYIWAAEISAGAHISARTPRIDVDANVSGNLSNSISSGLMGSFEARRNRWGILFDVFDVRLSKDSGPLLGGMLGTSSFEVTQNVVQLAGAYRAWDDKITPVDAVAGARYSYLKADLALSPSVVLPAGAGRASRAQWADVFIGVRAAHKISERWSLVGYADIGAGCTKISWQAIAGANYTFSKNMTAKFGYRVLDVDYENSRLQINLKTSGAYAGLGIRF